MKRVAKHLAKEKEAMKKVVTTSLRHRENVGRIGSLRVFCEMSVITVFPLKTGDLKLGSIPKTHLLDWSV